MEKHYYTCHYCSKSYIPRRRHKQKFCSNSCRVNSHKRKNKLSPAKEPPELKTPVEKPFKEGISMAGIGNATIANVVTEVGKSLFIKEENKPATKGDIQALFDVSNQRYLPVKNASKGNNGTSAHYDTKTKTVVYLKNRSPWI